MIPETLYMPNYTQQAETIDCGTLRDSVLQAWNIDWKIQAAVLTITIISFYLMVDMAFSFKQLPQENRKKALFHFIGIMLIWILSLWLVFVFNLF